MKSYNPAMVVVARESRGLTQVELSDRLENIISQSLLSKIENGRATITHEYALAIAGALQFDASLLEQFEHIEALGTNVNYRKRSSVLVRQIRQIEAELNIRKIQIQRLTHAFPGYREHRVPTITVDDGYTPQEIANEVRAHLQVPNGPILNLTRAVEGAGAIVVPMDFESAQVDGAYVWVNRLPPLFFMRRGAPGERFRFSLAHELGHAVMHSRKIGDGDPEAESDGFASEFLMPTAQIRSDLRNFDLDVALRLKPIWKVSIAALIEKAYGLEIINADKRKRLYQRMGARKMRRNEPLPLPMEHPTIVDELTQMHREQLGMSDADIDAMFFTSRMGTMGPRASTHLRIAKSESDAPLFNPGS